MENVSLFVLQIITLIFSCIITGYGFHRYIQKKNNIAQTLLIAFIMFTIALIFQIIAQLMTNFTIVTDNYILKLLIGYRFAYFSLSIGLYFMLRFSFSVFERDEASKKYNLITLILLICLIIFGLIEDYIVPQDIDEISDFLLSLDFYVVLYALLIIPAIIFRGLQLMKKVKGEPEYPKIFTITLMGIFLFITVLSLILETLVGMLTGDWTNFFSYTNWPIAIFCLFLAYSGFYKK